MNSRFNHGAKIIVVLLADIHVARIDAVFRQGAGAVRILLQQQVSVIVEVADDGNADAELVECFGNLRHGARRFVRVHGDTHKFRAGLRQRHHLIHGTWDIRGIGIGHGLDHNRIVSADLDTAHIDCHGRAARVCCHESSRKPLL